MQVLTLWFFIRCLTSLLAGFVPNLRTITAAERVFLYPPLTPSLSQWIEKIFISPWLRWDAVWYQRIVHHGYSATDGTAPFHPLFVLLATPSVKIGVSPTLSLLIISSLAGTILLMFIMLAQVDLNQNDAFFGLLLFALAPSSLITQVRRRS
jgi:hypothetical protein